MRHGGLWHNADFMRLWVGQTVSQIGSHVSGQAIPLAALFVLAATPFQMGVLLAVSGVPVLVVGLFAGVWVDRLKRRPLMIGADIGRALLLASIPVVWIVGALSFVHLLVVAVLVGVLSVFFDVADQSYLPVLVARENLMEGNSKRSASSSIAEIGGPPLGGVLVQVLTAPVAIAVDAVSYVVSAVCIGLIRKPELTPVPQEEREPMALAITGGLRLVLCDPVLRTLAGLAASIAFFGNFFGTLYSLFIVRDLKLPAATVGLLIGAGGIGALLGAFVAGRLVRAWGVGVTLGCAVLFAGAMQTVLLVVGGADVWVIGVLLATQLVGDVGWAVYAIVETTLRQSRVPDHLLGRANATHSVLSGGIAPVGALLSGVLGDTIGVRSTLAIAIGGIVMSALWIVLSPTLRLQTYPEPNPQPLP